MKKRFCVLLAAVLLGFVYVFAQGHITEPLECDVNNDGVADVSDIVATITNMKNGIVNVPSILDIIRIMKDGGGVTKVDSYFYLGTIKPTATNYKTLPGVITYYRSVDDAVGTTSYVYSGQTIYMLCPSKWVTGNNVLIEDDSGKKIIFSEEIDYLSITGYSIYKTQVWNESSTIILKKLSENNNVVTVTWDGNQARVDKGSVSGVDYSVDGADVVINSTDTHNELEFVLQGNSTNGSFTYTGNYKCRFYLNGLNLTSQKGAALDILCGKRIAMILNEGTNNTLADAPNGTQKGALYCKGHLEIEGGGGLVVTGNARHGICSKEYLELKKSTGSVTVIGAVGDGIHTGQYYLMSGGTVTVSGQQGDGIQAEILTLDDDITPDPDKEFNGQVFVKGGTINVTVAGDDKKGIKAADKMTVNGGTFIITASGKGSKGISVARHLLVNEDSGSTVMQIRATGGVYEDEQAMDESRCMGIKVTQNMAVTAGKIMVSNTGSKSRGIKVDGLYYQASGATVSANKKVTETLTMPPMD